MWDRSGVRQPAQDGLRSGFIQWMTWHRRCERNVGGNKPLKMKAKLKDIEKKLKGLKGNWGETKRNWRKREEKFGGLTEGKFWETEVNDINKGNIEGKLKGKLTFHSR